MCNIRNGSYYEIIGLQQSLVYQICLRPFKTTHSNNFLVLVHVILVTAWENVACNIRNGCTYATQFLKTVAFCLSWGQEGILYTLQQSMNITISFFVTFGGITSILVNPILIM